VSGKKKQYTAADQLVFADLISVAQRDKMADRPGGQ